MYFYPFLETSLSNTILFEIYYLFPIPILLFHNERIFFTTKAFGYGDNITTFAIPKKWVKNYWNKLEIKRYVCQRFNSL